MRTLQKKSIIKLLFGVTVPLIFVPIFASALSFSQIYSQLDYGSRGAEVSKLQTFLSANQAVYPEGLVTGYFGTLTAKAVQAFQALYNIAQVGRVGPLTLAKINEVIASGLWGSSQGYGAGPLKAPMFLSVNKNVGRDSVTFTWSTDEMATARIFYDKNFVKMNWGEIDSSGLGPLSGSITNGDGQFRTTQTLTLNNLQPNTTYHYILVSTDADGNVSVWNPNDVFMTSQ